MTVIRVSGDPGSGKTTLARTLAIELGYEFSYTGGIFRQMAEEKGKSIEEFYTEMKNNPDLEKEIDSRQAQLMDTGRDLVVDGRMAPFMPCHFPTINLLMKVSPEEGARRLKNRSENSALPLEEVQKRAEKRVREERERYKALYDIEDHLDEKAFDIVLNTDILNVKDAAVVALYLVRERLKKI
jgi:cytidylate kinase